MRIKIPRPALLFLYEIFNFFYDQILYPFGEYWSGRQFGNIQGIGIGWIVMALFAILQCAFFYYAFKHWKFDIAGVGYLQDLPDKDPASMNKLERFLAKRIAQVKKYDPRVFALLILNVDPYLVAVFYERKRFRELRECDWLSFSVVVLTANLWWGFRSALLATAFLWLTNLWNHVSHVWIIVAGLLILSMFYAPINPFLVEKK